MDPQTKLNLKSWVLVGPVGNSGTVWETNVLTHCKLSVNHLYPYFLYVSPYFFYVLTFLEQSTVEVDRYRVTGDICHCSLGEDDKSFCSYKHAHIYKLFYGYLINDQKKKIYSEVWNLARFIRDWLKGANGYVEGCVDHLTFSLSWFSHDTSTLFLKI